MKKLLGFLAITTLILSCEKDSKNTTEFISFDYQDKHYQIENTDNQIATGKILSVNHLKADSVILNYLSTYDIQDLDLSLTVYYFVKEDTTKVIQDSDKPYKNINDFQNGLLSTSNRFLNYPDTIIEFVTKGIDDHIVGFGVSNNNNSGLFIQLTDNKNDLIYFSDNLLDLVINSYDITDSWLENGANGGRDRIYFSGDFNLQLACFNDNKTISLTNGSFRIAFNEE